METLLQRLDQKHVALARISHHASTASAESSVLTALRSVGLLNVLHEYACEGLGRDALSGRPFRRLVTRRTEKCGLDCHPSQSINPRHQLGLMEFLNLEELAADKVYEFMFVAAPLRLVNGIGSPINP